MDAWLQYGALGLHALVILGIGMLLVRLAPHIAGIYNSWVTALRENSKVTADSAEASRQHIKVLETLDKRLAELVKSATRDALHELLTEERRREGAPPPPSSRR